MKIYSLLLISVLIFQNCTYIHKKSTPDKEDLESERLLKSDLNAFKSEYDSYYGFIVSNSDQHNFYNVDRKLMLKYVSNMDVDSITIKKDLLTSKWFSPIKGRSYDFYVWKHFIDDQSIIKSIDFQNCYEKRESLIFPVYITQFNARASNEKIKMDECNGDFPSEIDLQLSLNLVFVVPLNYNLANKYLEFRDTFDQKQYDVFLKNRMH